MGNTQERLSTGKKVNSALDNPTNFFAASAHTLRANALSSRKDGMNESIQAIKATSTGIEGIKSLLENAKGIIETARTTSQTGLAALYSSFNTIGVQIQTLINDSGYKGTNFTNGTTVTLDVLFNETGSNKLTVTGFNGLVSGLLNSNVIGTAAKVDGGYSNLLANMTAVSLIKAGSGLTGGTAALGTAVVAGFSNSYNLNAISNGLTAAISQLQAQASKMAANLAIINTRLDFTNSMINVVKTGADNLTLADTNEEGAYMLMLQTRNQLGTTSLSLASQAAQSVLRLF
jgi:flagellin-like hook-associated protein FlgL